MGRIGLLGGTFDPIHNAHLYMGQLCIDELNLDKVIYVPAGITPHKTFVADAGARYEMVKLAINSNERFSVSDYEIKKTTPSYSVETVDYFKKLYPEDEIIFILGEDSLDYVDRWYKAEKLLKMCSFAVIARGGFESDIEAKIKLLKENYGATVYNISLHELEISSMQIRDMISKKKSVNHLVPQVVLSFIEEHKMYRGE